MAIEVIPWILGLACPGRRVALKGYAGEHGGTYPSKNDIVFANQMILFSDVAGNTQAAKDAVFKYGPYLLRIPTLTVGDGKGNNEVADEASSAIGWIYDENNGKIRCNCGPSAADDEGVLFDDY